MSILEQVAELTPKERQELLTSLLAAESDQPPVLWEIRNLTDSKQFFPNPRDSAKDVVVPAHATAIVPGFMIEPMLDEGIKRAVENHIIEKPYQVAAPTPVPRPPEIPSDLDLNDKQRAAANEVANHTKSQPGAAILRAYEEDFDKWDSGDRPYWKHLEMVQLREFCKVLEAALALDAQSHALDQEERGEIENRLERGRTIMKHYLW